MRGPSNTQPPKHLGRAGRELFLTIQGEYGIQDAGGLLLLTQAGECADRLHAAREAIKQSGEIVMDRYNRPRLHPALTLEKDARAQLLQSIKLLGIELEPDALARERR